MQLVYKPTIIVPYGCVVMMLLTVLDRVEFACPMDALFVPWFKVYIATSWIISLQLGLRRLWPGLVWQINEILLGLFFIGWMIYGLTFFIADTSCLQSADPVAWIVFGYLLWPSGNLIVSCFI